MKERLQKIISSRGITSRRRAEEMIRSGLVTVNGKIAVLGESADPDVDSITVDGSPLPSMGERVYIMLNKPRGYITTLSDEKGRDSAAALVADCGTRVYPVGRLDMDSEGLLLFTNDGEFADYLMHPHHETEKMYLVWVNGYYESALEKLRQPIVLDGYRIKAPKVTLIRQTGANALLEVVIHEGRNRQIRRMCETAGVHTTRLKRIREGKLSLGELPLGKWRYLTAEEVKNLKK